MVTKIYMLRDKQIDYYRKRGNDVDILRHRGHTPIPYRDQNLNWAKANGKALVKGESSFEIPKWDLNCISHTIR